MRFSHTSYDDLPKRAQNIVDHLGGIDATIAYFKENSSFLAIPKTGNKTNFDLISLCENLSLISSKLNPVEVQIPCNFQDLVDCYLIKKKYVSVRLINYLNDLEEIDGFSLNFDSKTKYILKYFIHEYNFFNAKKIGSKTVDEIELIKQQIIALANYNQTSEAKTENLSKVIYRKLGYKIPLQRIEATIENDGFSYMFPDLFSIYLQHQTYFKSTKEFIDLYYFSDDNFDAETVAANLGITKERVRQLEVKVKTKILPNLIETFLNLLGNLRYKIFKQENEIIELLDDDFNELEYKYNTKFLIFICNYLNEYIVLNELIEVSKSFISPPNILFISNAFAEHIFLIDLLDFLDEEIYNFETVDFEYDRNILIKRFYDENDLYIEEANFIKISDLVETLIRVDWTEIEGSKKRKQKRKEKEDIYNLVHEFIQDKNESQKTKDILDFLHSNYVEISKVHLLHLLNKHISKFQRVGNGYWTITEFDKNVHGSIREIVEMILFESEVPLHFSKILDYLNTLRPLSEHSLRTNIKLHEDKIFTFFNCSFIGLASRIYDDYWYKLPKIIASNIKFIYNSKLEFKSTDEKAEYFSKLYNYPKIHLEYLLKNNEK